MVCIAPKSTFSLGTCIGRFAGGSSGHQKFASGGYGFSGLIHVHEYMSVQDNITKKPESYIRKQSSKNRFIALHQQTSIFILTSFQSFNSLSASINTSIHLANKQQPPTRPYPRKNLPPSLCSILHISPRLNPNCNPHYSKIKSHTELYSLHIPQLQYSHSIDR